MEGGVVPKVAVLLATYNGAAFLAAQLDSLAAQAGALVEVFARDDGSTDGTLDILASYATRWPALAAPIRGASLGPAGSFLALLAAAPEGFDAYAFCDQDDVWRPDKLATAARTLGGHDDAALYCARVTYVDADLRPLGESPPRGDARFEHLLFENIAFGNTVVMNAAARDLIRKRLPGAGVIMHDWWCALVVAAFGEVIYDPAPRVLYRQHRTNTIGASASRLVEIARHLKALWRDPRAFYPIHGQAAELLRLHGDRLTPSRRALVQRLVASRASLAGRLSFAAMGPMIRHRPIDALAGRLLLAAGLY